MKKSAELVRFENDMSKDEELRKQFEEAINRIVENKQAESDGEALTKAAAELGYELSIADQVTRGRVPAWHGWQLTRRDRQYRYSMCQIVV